MESLGETNRRYGAATSSRRTADHLIRLQLRCQDDASANERLPIVVVGSGAGSPNKAQEQNRNIIKFQEQASKMNYRHNKTSKSQQHQLVSSSVRRSTQKSSPKSSHVESPTPTPTANGGPVSPPQVQQVNSHHSTISINGHHSHTFGSHRSTATDSSGFSSGASTTSCYGQPQTMSSLNINDYQQRVPSISNEQQESRTNLIRSRLIEDLNRLEKIAAAAVEAKALRDLQTNTDSISPDNCTAPMNERSLVNGGSHTTPIPTLSRSGASNCVELNYSTLCRDEFSSFIDYKTQRTVDCDGIQKAQAFDGNNDLGRRSSSLQMAVKPRSSRTHRNGKAKKRRQTGGPMLVGVHECETPRDSDCIRSPSSFASSSSSLAGSERNLVFESSSSSETNSLTKGDSYDEDNADHELICHEISDEDDDGSVDQLIESASEIARNSAPEPHCEARTDGNYSEGSSMDLNDDQHVRRLATEASWTSPCENSGLSLSNKNPGDQDKLSEMLDAYLCRVESLLKLANGDKSVTFEELIEGRSVADQRDAREIIVRDEFKTSITYVPSSQCPISKPKVIQEIEMVVENEKADTDDEDKDQVDCNAEKVTTNLGSDFGALTSSPQTSAILNWWPKQLQSATEAELDDLLLRDKIDDENNNKHTNSFINEQQCRLLERSFLSRWLELSSLEGEVEPNESYSESLVKTIRRHMSEFVASYNAYQESMRHETSFALDWHENWLFATSLRKCMPLKRTHQLSELHLSELSASSSSSEAHAKSSNDNTSGQQEQLNMKRAKMMQSSSSFETNELLNYSTLLINKYKPVKVTFFEEHDCDESGTSGIDQQANKYKRLIDACYEQQSDHLSELQQTFLELSGQVNVCQLLLNDSFADLDCDHVEPAKLGAKRPKRSLEIEYESTLNSGRSLIDGQLLCFRTHGHLFELRKLRHFESLTTSVRHKRKLKLLRELILARLRAACHWRDPAIVSGGGGIADNQASESKLVHVAKQLPLEQCQQDQVRFVVPITDVRVGQALPVIQFCARVTGALPIRVGWYRLLEDGSQRELTTRTLSATSRSKTTDYEDHEWPLTMRASYELEYQNDWLSWYRFKREQGEILFEIRGAHLEQDYGQTFKCVIENYCSIKECEFRFELKQRREPNGKLINPLRDADGGRVSARATTTRTKATGNRQREAAALARSEGEFSRVRLNKVEPSSENQEAGQAILRTWSQRTLNKRAPLVDHNDLNSGGGSSGEQADSASLAAGSDSSLHTGHGVGCQQLQTVGRLSAQAMNDCKFGTNYPYHPVSLMRRLEENKMSLTLRSRLRLVTRRPDDDHLRDASDLSVGTTWDCNENSNSNNNKEVQRTTACGLEPIQQHNHQANQESEPCGSSCSPFASVSAPSNRPEVRDCGELGASRQTANFMRPSHRQLIPNTTSGESQLLSDDRGNQDNAENDGQQKSDEVSAYDNPATERLQRLSV